MLVTIWAILNIVLSIGAVVLIIRTSSKIRTKYGIGFALFFAVVVFSLAGRNPYNESNQTNNNSWKGSADLHIRINSTHFQSIVLDKDWLSEFMLQIIYGENEETKLNTVTSAWVGKNGTFFGTNWGPASLQITDLGNNRISYHISADHTWHLVGLTMFSDARNFTGEVVLK